MSSPEARTAPGCRPACRSRAGARPRGRRQSAPKAPSAAAPPAARSDACRRPDDQLRVVRLHAARAPPRTRTAGPPPPTNVVTERSTGGASAPWAWLRPNSSATCRTIVSACCGHLVGGRDRGVFRQPDVDIGEVREVLREELHFEAAHRQPAADEHQQRDGQRGPAMIDERPGHAVVEAGRTALPVGRAGHGARGAQQVAAEQRDERHRHDARGDQRAREHDRQAVDEVAGAAGQQQQRQVGDDVGDGGEQDRRGELRRSQPGGDPRRQPAVETALDGVAGHDRVVDEQPERDDERRDRHLLQVDAQHAHEPEGHAPA